MAVLVRTGQCKAGKWMAYTVVHDDSRIEGLYVTDKDLNEVPDETRAMLGNSMIADHNNWSQSQTGKGGRKYMRKTCELMTDRDERAQIRVEHDWMHGERPFYPWAKFIHIPAKEQPTDSASI